MPAQKPELEAPDARAEAFRTRSIKVTTQPPRPTGNFVRDLRKGFIEDSRIHTFNSHIRKEEE
jgi:hypothetical protein